MKEKANTSFVIKLILGIIAVAIVGGLLGYNIANGIKKNNARGSVKGAVYTAQESQEEAGKPSSIGVENTAVLDLIDFTSMDKSEAKDLFQKVFVTNAEAYNGTDIILDGYYWVRPYGADYITEFHAIDGRQVIKADFKVYPETYLLYSDVHIRLKGKHTGNSVESGLVSLINLEIEILTGTDAMFDCGNSKYCSHDYFELAGLDLVDEMIIDAPVINMDKVPTSMKGVYWKYIKEKNIPYKLTGISRYENGIKTVEIAGAEEGSFYEFECELEGFPEESGISVYVEGQGKEPKLVNIVEE